MATTRNHPVWEVIQHAAQFGQRGTPNAKELDALGLTSRARQLVEDAAQSVAKIHDTGEHAPAWAKADELARMIIDALPEHQQSDGYVARELGRREDGITDPAELAAMVKGER